MQRHSRVEWKFFVPVDQASSVVRGKSQTGDLGESRVEILQISFQGQSGLIGLGGRILGSHTKGGPETAHAGHDTTNTGYRVDRGAITLGPLGLIQERYVGLRYFGVDVLQSDVHRTHGNGQILEARKQVEEVVRGEGEFGGLDILRGELQCPEGQSRRQRQGGGERSRRGEGGWRLWGRDILELAAELEGIGKRFLVRTDEAGQILGRRKKELAMPRGYSTSRVEGGEKCQKISGLTLMKSCPSSVLSFSMTKARDSS